MDKPINQIIAIKSFQQVKSYLEERPNINLAIMLDKNGTNLLHFAAFKNDLARMKLFIRHYKQFTLMNHGTGMYTGETTFNGKLKAWVNSQNNQGYLPIHYAALHGNIEMIKFLEEIGTNMHYKTSKDQNVLFMAAQYNQIKTLIYLLESSHNLEVNSRNCRQETVLHVAAMKGFIQMISYLLTKGADIEAADSSNNTPLIAATKQNKKESVKILLIKGADRQAYDNEQQTALKIAMSENRQELVRILDDNFGTWDKIKIKCNMKIIYAPQKPTYTYSILFILFFHLFFLPVNILTQFKIDQKYIKIIPFIGQGIYEALVILFYLLLFIKYKKRQPKNMLDVNSPFCAQCKRDMNPKAFHCYICARCVYRYDHHCPWINNCVGSHNVGKFTFFLFLLSIGLAQVVFCSVCMMINNQPFVEYRTGFDIPNGIHIVVNVATIIFGTLLFFGIANLLLGQLKNIFTNSTSMQRSKGKKKAPVKKSTILTENNMNESLQTEEQEEEQEANESSCCSNMVQMLTGPS